MATKAEPTTTVTVPRGRLDPTVVPQVCLKTGEPAQCLIATRASTTPSWVWLLVLPGGVPYVIARRWVFRHLDLTLPARNLVFEQWQLVRRGVAGGATLALVLLVYSVATLSPTGVFAAAFVGSVTTASWLLLTPRVWVGAELDGDQVTLYGVHTGAARVLRAAR